jgi:hypothetical protein
MAYFPWNWKSMELHEKIARDPAQLLRRRNAIRSPPPCKNQPKTATIPIYA